MTVEYFEYKGIQYPVRLVYLMNVEYHGQCENAYIADYELWAAIKDDYDAGVKEQSKSTTTSTTIATQALLPVSRLMMRLSNT